MPCVHLGVLKASPKRVGEFDWLVSVPGLQNRVLVHVRAKVVCGREAPDLPGGWYLYKGFYGYGHVAAAATL